MLQARQVGKDMVVRRMLHIKAFLFFDLLFMKNIIIYETIGKCIWTNCGEKESHKTRHLREAEHKAYSKQKRSFWTQSKEISKQLSQNWRGI